MSSLLSAGALIHYLHKSHNTPLLPPKNLHSHCFQLLLGHFHVPREITNNGYAKVLVGSTGVLWDCASSELTQIKSSVGFWGGENWRSPRKTSRTRVENQQIQPRHYDDDSRNRTQATFVGGECSHNYASPCLKAC